MNYDEIFKQADELEARAKKLREDAEKQRKEAEAIEAKKKEAKISMARKTCLAAVMSYVEALTGKKLTEDEAEKTFKAMEEALEEIESEFTFFNKLFDNSTTVKVSNPKKSTTKTLSDEDIIKAFLKSL